jgi:hypothetical protein
MASFVLRDGSPGSALALLVPRVLADHPDHAFTADDLAVLAHLLDRRTDFHFPISGFPGGSPGRFYLYL